MLDRNHPGREGPAAAAGRPETFAEWWPVRPAEYAKKFPTKSSLARAVGYAPRHVDRLMGGVIPQSRTVCERLFEITGLACFQGKRCLSDATGYGGPSTFLEDERSREACMIDATNIRVVAGPEWIVCPGTRKSFCGRLSKVISRSHLREHFPGSKSPADDLRGEWGLPWGFSLISHAIERALVAKRARRREKRQQEQNRLYLKAHESAPDGTNQHVQD